MTTQAMILWGCIFLFFVYRVKKKMNEHPTATALGKKVAVHQISKWFGS